jgi:hypothetical protein
VLLALDHRVDGGAVDHGRALAHDVEHAVDHLDHLGRVGHAQEDDVRCLGHAAGRSTVAGAPGHGGLDRAPASRGHGDVVAGFDQVPGHRETHGTQADESDAHVSLRG